MKGPNCYLCGSLQMVKHRPQLDLGMEGVDVFRCALCDLVQNHPRLSKDYSRLFPRGSQGVTNTRHWLSFEEYERQQVGTKVFLADWVESVWREHRRDGGVRLRGLEIGCHTGLLLHLLSQRNALAGEWVGVEPDADAAAWGRQRHDATIHAGYLGQVALEPGPFDLALLMEVLEHSSDPSSLLRETRGLMRGDGLLFVVVPNVLGCTTAEEFFVQEHIFHFSTATLRRLAEGAGFSVVREQEASRPAAIPRSWIQALKRHPSISYLGRKCLSSPLARLGRGTIVKPGMIMAVYRAAS